MREFFRGWRRKVGCVSLVMACLFGVAWGRSQFVVDKIEVPGWDSGSECKSYPGYISWTWRSPSDQFEKIRWTSQVLSNWREIDIWTYNDPRFDWNWGGIKFGSVATGRWSAHQGEDSIRGEIRTHFRAVYYWVLALPLTLLSACLILWKPRVQCADLVGAEVKGPQHAK